MEFTEKTRTQIKDAILNQCEGITHMEFSIDKIDEIVQDIETAVNEQEASEPALGYRQSRDGSVSYTSKNGTIRWKP
jgi:hypothetical protein